MKKGSDGRRCLFYLDKAVELNDYDEEVMRGGLLTQRFIRMSFRPSSRGASKKIYDGILAVIPHCDCRCYHHLGRNREAIEDALLAVEREPSSGNFTISHSISQAFHLLLHFLTILSIEPVF